MVPGEEAAEVDGEMSALARSVYLLNLELEHMYTLHAMVVFVTEFTGFQ